MHHAQLRAFHAVAAAGGFTAAAAKLGVGQPTLSLQLSELGSQLFKLTQRVFGAEAEAIDLLSAVRDFRAGHLQIGAVGPYHVTEMLAVFTARYPHIRVTVSIGNSQAMLDLLADLRCDVAVLAQLEDDPRFFSLPYSRHSMVAMVHRDHGWARRRSVRLAEFAGQRVVLR